MAETKRGCAVVAAAVVDDVTVVEAETVCVSVWSPHSGTTVS